MKDQLPAPEFDGNQYERPNQRWVCGRASEGAPCRVGPDCRGRCQATFECQPAIETREGEAKGRYRCTRPKEFGGPCESGPMPDGTCCRAIPKCVPARSLRSKRGVFSWAVVAATVAVLLILLAGPKRMEFINPGPISDPHSGAAFARLHGGTNAVNGCAACHVPAESGLHTWTVAAIGANPGPFHWRELVETAPPSKTALDSACLKCHAGHSFHAPNVVREHSCSACHQEHKGNLALHQPDDRNCATCHADAAVMQASAAHGRKLEAGLFDFRPALGRGLFKAPRPTNGYTQVFSSFKDHPEFQVIREGLKEPNTLRFNHARHFADDITAMNRGKLACAKCHQPDASGEFHLKISFEQQCHSCHSLQFDAANPGLRLPHGDAEAVRAFLRSLPNQYADFARRQNGLSSQREVETHVRAQLAALREQVATVEELEQKVFFSTKRWAPGRQVGAVAGSATPQFYGCAYCHEVTPNLHGAPKVTPAQIPDRWFIRGGFNHQKHTHIDCARCHDVTRSQLTSDILLPGKTSCVACHSPEGGVASSCSTCHSYHTPRRAAPIPETRITRLAP